MARNSDKLVSKELIEEVRKDLEVRGRPPFQRWLRQVEPDLLDAIMRRCMTAVPDDESDLDILREAAQSAVLDASLLAVVALGRANHRLWAESAMGTPLSRLAADLSKINLYRDLEDGGWGPSGKRPK